MDLRPNSRTFPNLERAEQSIGPEEITDEGWRTRRQRPRSRETTSPTGPVTSRSRSMRQELRRILSSRRSIRQAIILNEIIGPPKALQQEK